MINKNSYVTIWLDTRQAAILNARVCKETVYFRFPFPLRFHYVETPLSS